MRSRRDRLISSVFEMPLSGRLEIRPAIRAIADSLPDFAAMAQRNRRLARLEQEIRGAPNYAAYRQACLEYDKESELEEWKHVDASPLYDYKLIQRRLSQILAAREGGFVRRLIFILQEGLHGNLGNISNPLLYRFTRFGTKRLIEHYLDEVCGALEYLCECETDEISPEERLDFFESTSQTFGQSCLMLSGGAALGIYHMGVVKSLWENGLLPHVISGSSAGSIVASVLGTHNDEELHEVMQHREALVDLIKWNEMPSPYLFNVDHFNRTLKARIGEMSFKEAFEYSGRAINITVSPYDPMDEGRLLNYRTSPTVVLNSAVRASCAAPFLLPPAELFAKTLNGEIVPYLKNHKFLDGSIGDDLPIRRLTRLYGVNHSIVSLVNPLVLPFVSRRVEHGTDLRAVSRRFGTRLLKDSGDYVLQVFQRVLPSDNAGFFIDKVRSVITQEYRGDITLIPPRRLNHLFSLLTSHSMEEEAEFIEIGARLTWPNLEMIKNTTSVSRTFRQCLERVRVRNGGSMARSRGRRG